MEELYHMIVDEELSNAEILRINQDYILQLDKIDKVRTTYLQEKYKGKRRLNIECLYVHGVTGTGKSRNILDTHGDENVYRVTDYQHPFDHYSCQEVIVFEEFRSSLPMKDMLNYLDIYPLLLPARYSNKYACYTKVYICSNWELERQYYELQNQDDESWQAFLRRIHKVKEYTIKGIKNYNSITDYIKRKEEFIEITELSKEEQLELPFL